MTLPQTKLAPSDPYELCVYRTRTGEVVRWLPLVSTPRWESGLNIVGSWGAQIALDSRYISKADLSAIADPWYWSWAVVQGNVIHQAGPVTSEDFADDGSLSTSFSGQGLWALYKEKRVAVNAGRTSTAVITGIDADISFGTTATSDKGGPIPVANRNINLGTIVKRLLENEQAKSGGALPIVLPTDASLIVPSNPGQVDTRTYQGPELSKTGDLIYALTQVINGPEVELAAEFTDSTRSLVQHRVRIGTPRLGQLGYPHAWTYRSACTRFGHVTDGGLMRDRGWDKGAGFERNVFTGFSENLAGVTTGPVGFQTRPLLEDVGQQHSSSENQPELDGYAAADVANGRKPTLQLAVEVTMNGDNGDGETPPSVNFASVANGDTGVVFVRNHPRLEDGKYSIRVIRKSSSASTSERGTLTVDFLGRASI